MERLQWIGDHWFDLFQTVGIVGGLLFTAYLAKKDDRSREIANLIAIKGQYREIWKEFYDQPQLSRVLEKGVDLTTHPVSPEENLFVRLLILHLDTVHRAMKADIFVSLEGLEEDIREFFSAPIPRAIWEKLKPFQDKDFVEFVERCLSGTDSDVNAASASPPQSTGLPLLPAVPVLPG